MKKDNAETKTVAKTDDILIKFKVNEIFYSIDGEGIRAGFPVVFIRLFGCNLKCSYCDSTYSNSGTDFKEMTTDEILAEVAKYACPRITVTGGEPLITPDVLYLICRLTGRNYKVNIETNGSMNIENYVMNPNVLVTMDYKCPSSDMEDKMLLSNLSKLRKTDVIKFVVGDKNDLDTMRAVIVDNNLTCLIFVSPVFGKIEPKDIVQYLKDNSLTEVRMQLQMHKFIWEPTKRGV